MRQLTAVQSEALSALKAAGRPLTAYEVLAMLRSTRPTAAPPTAYRALAKLIGLGLVHRLESINAYVPCCAAHEGAEPAFTICGDCGSVSEFAYAGLSLGVDRALRSDGFRPVKAVIEVHGRCASCEAGA